MDAPQNLICASRKYSCFIRIFDNSKRPSYFKLSSQIIGFGQQPLETCMGCEFSIFFKDPKWLTQRLRGEAVLSLTHPTVYVTSTSNVSCSTLHAHTSAPQTPATRTFLNPFSYDEASLVLLSPQGLRDSSP